MSLSGSDISTSMDFGSYFRGIFRLPSPQAPQPPVVPLGNGLCYQGQQYNAVPLSSNYTCPPHFYCPNINVTDPLSVPSMCPPTLECQMLRLTSNFCPPQGRYEPVPCPKGSFCPTFNEKFPCPAGSFCPTGTIEPVKCSMPFSNCPQGSVRQQYYGGIIISLGIDAIMLLALLFLSMWTVRLKKKRSKQASRSRVGRSVGTLSEINRSKESGQVEFLTADQSGDLDNDSEFAGKHGGIKHYWRKRIERIVNYIGTIVPVQFHLSKYTKQNDGPVIVHTTHESAHSHTTIDMSASSGRLGAAADYSRNRAKGRPVTKAVNQQFSLHLADLLQGFRRAQNGQDLSLHFEFDKLSLTLPSGKCILNGVNGHIVPGRVTVIMGPSGAGKSTFMNVLMGKLDRTGGKLMINGLEVEMHKYKKIIGYVPQEDVMLEELTVRENIAYSGHTRLPRSWSRSEIEKFVDNVLDALELSHVAHSLVSDVSGGQRKRVNIGMELVTAPSAIFLDEPSSGLDATAALKVANIMKKVAANIGITVVAVVHQPRYEIFQEFDDMLMIAPGGKTAYLGPTVNCCTYFEALGFYFNPRNNPADVLMDIVSGKGERLDPSELPDDHTAVDIGEHMSNLVAANEAQFVEYEVRELTEAWAVQEMHDRSQVGGTVFIPFGQKQQANESDKSDKDQADDSLHVPYTRKNRKSMVSISSASYYSQDQSHTRLRKACKERGANFFLQAWYSHNRSLLQQYRRKNAFFLELCVACIAGALMGLAVSGYNGSLYQGLLIVPFTLLSPSPIEVVVPILCLLVSCAIGLSAAPAAVKTFSEERDVYWREASGGHSALAYFIGKNVSTTYRFLITSWHFTSLYHYFASPNISFFEMYMIHLLMFFSVYGMSFALGMLVRRENASMTAVCLTVVMAVLCGDGPNITDLKKIHMDWILDMSYARWGAEAWYSKELLFFDGVYEIRNVSAALFGYTLERYWFDIFIMLLHGLIWRALAFLLMVSLNRQKQR